MDFRVKKVLLNTLLLTSLYAEVDDTNQTTLTQTLSTVPEQEEYLNKHTKVILTNAIMGGATIYWGLTKWDYGSDNPVSRDEGWFEKETSNGGSDKLGHFYTNYLTTRIFSSLFNYWGYSKSDAALYAAVTSMVQSVIFVEIGDSSSKGFGFSYQDAIMDVVGAAVGYIWEMYPTMSNKIDFRVEYAPDFSKPIRSDITTDYENMKHLMVLKAEGFTNTPVLEYFELHLGYYTRKFYHGRGPIDERERTIYAGVGINLSKVFRPVIGKYSTFFNYYQTPYTYVSYDKEIE